jgi:hypothetical protein
MVSAQERRDKGEFINAENKFYKQIEESIEMFNKGQPAPKAKVFKMDFSTIDFPKSVDEFQTVWSGKNPQRIAECRAAVGRFLRIVDPVCGDAKCAEQQCDPEITALSERENRLVHVSSPGCSA